MPEWKVGGVTLPHGPYMIGAGVCKSPEATMNWLRAAPTVSGSYTKDVRPGNPGTVMYPQTLDEFLELGAGLNAYGMPNMGFVAAAKQFAGVKIDQPLIISIAGFSIGEYVEGVRVFGSLENVSAIELNFGCPNTQGDHKTIMSFDPDSINQVMSRVMALGLDVPIWVKLSPYSNSQDLERVAKVLNRFVAKGTFRIAVVTCNTFPLAYAGENTITAQDGFAGLSGPAIKMIALGQVKQFRQHLSSFIDIIGVGGGTCGNDVVDFLDAGAKAVQVTSLAHWAGDPTTFNNHFLSEQRADRLFALLESSQ